MADVPKDATELLVQALVMKLASLKRAAKSAAPVFQAVYDAEVMRHNDLLSWLQRGGLNETAAHEKGKKP